MVTEKKDPKLMLTHWLLSNSVGRCVRKLLRSPCIGYNVKWLHFELAQEAEFEPYV
jgi:hypothetical protein